jgi:3-oxoacyl-[acyl-carrier protein] reductase
MDLKLSGKRVLIIGASKGIGRGICLAFALEKAAIVAVARTASLLEEIKTECLNKGASSFDYLARDIMEQDNYRFAEDLVARFGNFDVIIHCVGGSLTSRDVTGGYRDYEYALKFNALCSIDMNSYFMKKAVADGTKLRIVHISSISADKLRGNALYASAKAYLNAYVTSVGREMAPKGIALNSVMPGAVAFEGSYWAKLIEEKAPKVEDFLRHHQAINRFGTVEEVANLVLFLASEKASFIVASNIPVDGGNM